MSIPVTQLNRVFAGVGAQDSYKGVYGFAHDELGSAIKTKHDELCRVELIVSEHTYVKPKETAFAIKTVFGKEVFGLVPRKRHTKRVELTKEEKQIKAVQTLKKSREAYVASFEKKSASMLKKAEKYAKKVLEKKALLGLAGPLPEAVSI